MNKKVIYIFPLFTATLCGEYCISGASIWESGQCVKEKERQGERMNTPFCFKTQCRADVPLSGANGW